jgi:sulfatase maturation enzyme AslB (radical SAM superfamily)
MLPLEKIVKEKNACSLPWLMAEIQLHDDIIAPCCKYEGNFGSLKTTKFPIIWANQNFQKIRNQMANGEIVKECSACYISDDVFAYKDKKNADYQHLFDEVDTNADITLPRSFHIHLRNICNLACRMCGPNQSNRLDRLISKSENLKTYFPILQDNAYIDPKKLSGSFIEARYVTFVGGEPMIDSDCMGLLKLIKEEATKLKEITFITNLTKINYKLLDIATSMDVSVVLAVSIDGPPTLQEYIRHFSKWDKIYRNMMYVRERYPNIKFGFNSTISIMNVGYVGDTLKFLHSLEFALRTKFKFCNPSIVHDKKFLYPGNIPSEVKNLYLEKLNNYSGRLTIPGSEDLLKSAIGLLKEQPKEDFERFINFISEFDKQAGTDYKKIYPEFNT